jgi:hypothetical protein
MSLDPRLRLDQSELYEVGALLLTAIVSAQNFDNDQSQELFRSLCARALRLQYLANPDDMTPIKVKPQYVFREAKSINKDLAFAGQRFGERKVAGRMAIAFFKRAHHGAPVQLPSEIKRLSINQFAEYVMETPGRQIPKMSKSECGSRAGQSSIFPPPRR